MAVHIDFALRRLLSKSSTLITKQAAFRVRMAASVPHGRVLVLDDYPGASDALRLLLDADGFECLWFEKFARGRPLGAAVARLLAARRRRRAPAPTQART